MSEGSPVQGTHVGSMCAPRAGCGRRVQGPTPEGTWGLRPADGVTEGGVRPARAARTGVRVRVAVRVPGGGGGTGCEGRVCLTSGSSPPLGTPRRGWDRASRPGDSRGAEGSGGAGAGAQNRRGAAQRGRGPGGGTHRGAPAPLQGAPRGAAPARRPGWALGARPRGRQPSGRPSAQSTGRLAGAPGRRGRGGRAGSVCTHRGALRTSVGRRVGPPGRRRVRSSARGGAEAPRGGLGRLSEVGGRSAPGAGSRRAGVGGGHLVLLAPRRGVPPEAGAGGLRVCPPRTPSPPGLNAASTLRPVPSSGALFRPPQLA